MYPMIDVPGIILVIVSCVSAYADYKTGEIPNWITYPLILIGLFFTDVIGLLIGLIIFGSWWFFLHERVGGGDTKLLVGIALIQPLIPSHSFLLNTILLSILFSLIAFLFNKARSLLEGRRLDFSFDIRFAPYICIGVILTYFGLIIL